MAPHTRSERPTLGAFLPTYRRPTILKETIRQILDQSWPPDVLLIIDNAADYETRGVVDHFSDGRLVYEAPASNLGSAGGTEYGVRWLYERGHDLIYCGDDDDPPRTTDTFRRIVELTASGSEPKGAGAVGSLWDWNTGELRRLPDEMLSGVLEVDMIGGNQHLIIPREIVEFVGPPNGRLFFGYPDLEFSLRIRMAGFSLYVDGDLMREYRRQAGRLNLQRRRSLVPRRSYDNIWRNYYTTRNYLYMMHHTFRRPDLVRRELAKISLRTLAAWVRGPRYGARFLRFQIMGIVDGYRGRLGPRVEPTLKYPHAR